MLRLNGPFGIGSQIDVTFAKPDALTISQELIDGRTGRISVTSQSVMPGDRWRATIIKESPCRRFYFLRAETLLEQGNGQRSHLERLLSRISMQDAPNFEEGLLMRMGREFSYNNRGEQAWLETLLDLLEYQTFAPEELEFRTPVTPIRYGHYVIVIVRLINKLYPDDPAARAALYERAAGYCRERSVEWHDALRAAAAVL